MSKNCALTKKPIPTDPDVWRNEVNGTLRFLDECSKLRDGLDDRWVAKQIAYYSSRLHDLYEHPPRDKWTGARRFHIMRG